MIQLFLESDDGDWYDSFDDDTTAFEESDDESDDERVK